MVPAQQLGQEFGQVGLWLFNEGPLFNGAHAALFTTDEESEVSRDAFRPYRKRPLVVGYGTSDMPGDPAAQSAAFRAAAPALRGRRYLLFLSRIHPTKGCDLLLDAFTVIVAALPDLNQVTFGPDQVDWARDLKAQASAARIMDPIRCRAC